MTISSTLPSRLPPRPRLPIDPAARRHLRSAQLARSYQRLSKNKIMSWLIQRPSPGHTLISKIWKKSLPQSSESAILAKCELVKVVAERKHVHNAALIYALLSSCWRDTGGQESARHCATTPPCGAQEDEPLLLYKSAMSGHKLIIIIIILLIRIIIRL